MTAGISPAAGAAHPELRPVPGAFIVTLEEGAGSGPLHAAISASGGLLHHTFRLLPGRYSVRQMSPDGARALRQVPGVSSVRPDYEVYAALTESVPLLGALVTDFAMRNTDGGLGIAVCVLDTGMNPFHAMFDDDNNVETPTNRVSAWKDFLFGLPDPYDDNGHGSHVAGTIFGRTGLTIAGQPFQGMAPRGRMYIGKVLNFGGTGLFSDLQAGIEWCAGMAPDSPFPPADVISLSLGAGRFHDVCDDDPTGTAQIINAAASAGVLVVSAAGNEQNINAALTPACATGSMAIGATYDADVGAIQFLDCTDPLTVTDRLLCLSNRWDHLDVVAPGCATVSAAGSGGIRLASLCGTSMATAHVAGLAALVMGANRTMTGAEVRQRIVSTALDLGNPGFDRAHGAGRVQAGFAVDVPCHATEPAEASCGDGVDNDCDGQVDCGDGDCCGGAVCGLTDTDGDGFGACDCDDTNPAAWNPPGEVGPLVVTSGGGAAFLDWTPPAEPGSTSVSYDTVRSASAGDFFAGASCVETTDGGDTTATDTQFPLSGATFFYLVRAGNGCPATGAGAGVDSDGVTRTVRICP
ncbi:MAG: S8 family serine peptidase [Acidobacteriota bacterium]